MSVFAPLFFHAQFSSNIYVAYFLRHLQWKQKWEAGAGVLGSEKGKLSLAANRITA